MIDVLNPISSNTKPHILCNSLLFAAAQHFDVSYWAFEQLAHPVYGVAMIDFQTVDCDSGAPLPYGYISKTVIYFGGTKPGWSWQPYGSGNTQFTSDSK